MSSYYGPLRGRRAGAAGGGGGSVVLHDADIGLSVIDPNNATAQFRVTSGGVVEGTGEADYDWLIAGAAADYEVRADVTSGSLGSGTTGSWLSLSSTRAWSVTRSVLGTSSATMTVRIRRASDAVVLETATISLEATVDI